VQNVKSLELPDPISTVVAASLQSMLLSWRNLIPGKAFGKASDSGMTNVKPLIPLDLILIRFLHI
jgi:hypothetical protein